MLTPRKLFIKGVIITLVWWVFAIGLVTGFFFKVGGYIEERGGFRSIIVETGKEVKSISAEINEE